MTEVIGECSNKDAVCIVGVVIDVSQTPNEIVNTVLVREDGWNEFEEIYEKDFPNFDVQKQSELSCEEGFESDVIGIGWTLGSDNIWYPPVVETIPVPVYENMAVGSFYDRFGGEKFPILMSEDPMIRAFISDTRVRRSISLKAQDTIDGVNYIHSSGFNIDPYMILNTPIQPNELP